MDQEKNLWGEPLERASGKDDIAEPRGEAEAEEPAAPRGLRPQARAAGEMPIGGEAMIVVENVLESTAAQPDAMAREYEMVQALLYLANRIDMLAKRVESGALPVAREDPEAPAGALPHVETVAAERGGRGTELKRETRRAPKSKMIVFWIAVTLVFATGIILLFFGNGAAALSSLAG